jgi:hypothetical protein
MLHQALVDGSLAAIAHFNSEGDGPGVLIIPGQEGSIPYWIENSIDASGNLLGTATPKRPGYPVVTWVLQPQ